MRALALRRAVEVKDQPANVDVGIKQSPALVCLTADKKHTHSGNEEASDEDVEYDDDDEHAPSFYDKSKSFFDNISCDATAKAYRYYLLHCLNDATAKAYRYYLLHYCLLPSVKQICCRHYIYFPVQVCGLLDIFFTRDVTDCKFYYPAAAG